MSTERREIMIASPYHKTAREELNTRMKTRLKPKMRLMEHKGPLCAVHIVLVAARMRLQFCKALLALFYCGFAGGHKSSRKKVNIDQNIIMIWCRCAQNCINRTKLSGEAGKEIVLTSGRLSFGYIKRTRRRRRRCKFVVFHQNNHKAIQFTRRNCFQVPLRPRFLKKISQTF